VVAEGRLVAAGLVVCEIVLVLVEEEWEGRRDDEEEVAVVACAQDP
jgi:hypothetical protein